jgi:hypothetical protein
MKMKVQSLNGRCWIRLVKSYKIGKLVVKILIFLNK